MSSLNENESVEHTREAEDDIDVEVEYVPEELSLPLDDPTAKTFGHIFEAFKKISEGVKEHRISHVYKKEEPLDPLTKAAVSEQILQDEMAKKKEREDTIQMSRRKLRLSLQPQIADLKASTSRPDLVEFADVTARDPFLLVQLKTYRNTVPVPKHWNGKRKYLAGKRGFERQPFELPDFIKRTGIMELREAVWEKEHGQSLKAMMRERVRPKLGRIDIDYQKLHDAFFRWQTKPSMSRMGDLYYEGKELEEKMRDRKPGELTDELRIALGMPLGPNAHKYPPPYLIAMQRYGPPPSYPNLKIPGLNCPIPEGCAFGYHAGGWGKPPVDDFGKPLYGDVFGLAIPLPTEVEDEFKIVRKHWGEIEDEEGSDEESDIDVDEDTEIQPPTDGYVTPSGMATPSLGISTPQSLELRKKRTTDSEAGTETPGRITNLTTINIASIPVLGAETSEIPSGHFYHVIPEKKVDRISGQMMASTHVYDLSKKQPGTDGVEITFNPEELDLSDRKDLEKRYEEQLRKQTRTKVCDEDGHLSESLAAHSTEQNRKRKIAEQKKAKDKKGKEFKF